MSEDLTATAPGLARDLVIAASARVEMALYRYKVPVGRSLRARTLSAQKIEARIACAVISRMTRLGMPVSRKVA